MYYFLLNLSLVNFLLFLGTLVAYFGQHLPLPANIRIIYLDNYITNKEYLKNPEIYLAGKELEVASLLRKINILKKE